MQGILYLSKEKINMTGTGTNQGYLVVEKPEDFIMSEVSQIVSRNDQDGRITVQIKGYKLPVKPLQMKNQSTPYPLMAGKVLLQRDNKCSIVYEPYYLIAPIELIGNPVWQTENKIGKFLTCDLLIKDIPFEDFAKQTTLDEMSAEANQAEANEVISEETQSELLPKVEPVGEAIEAKTESEVYPADFMNTPLPELLDEHKQLTQYIKTGDETQFIHELKRAGTNIEDYYNSLESAIEALGDEAVKTYGDPVKKDGPSFEGKHKRKGLLVKKVGDISNGFVLGMKINTPDPESHIYTIITYPHPNYKVSPYIVFTKESEANIALNLFRENPEWMETVKNVTVIPVKVLNKKTKQELCVVVKQAVPFVRKLAEETAETVKESLPAKAVSEKGIVM